MARFLITISPLFCILNMLILLAVSQDIQDTNKSNLNDESIKTSEIIVIDSSSWNGILEEHRRLLMELILNDYISEELLPWISGKPLIIRINKNIVDATDGVNYVNIEPVPVRGRP